MRTIRLHPCRSDRFSRSVDTHAERDAINYLSQWASPHFRDGDARPDTVDLYPSLGMTPDDYEIVAVYRHENAERPFYTIGAIYRPEEKRFTFHS